MSPWSSESVEASSRTVPRKLGEYREISSNHAYPWIPYTLIQQYINIPVQTKFQGDEFLCTGFLIHPDIAALRPMVPSIFIAFPTAKKNIFSIF